MAETTEIEWTDATWQIVTGCSIKSPGCNNCYAMRLAGSRLRNHPSRTGLTHKVKGKSVWTGEVRFNEAWLDQPLRWKNPRDIFVAAHGDIGHEGVTDEMLDRIFGTISLALWHKYQILTKRPDRVARYVETNSGAVRDICYRPERYFSPAKDPTIGKIGSWPARWPGWPMSHVWIGTSVERQQEADERRPHLEALARMGWNTWVSYEPALGPVNWSGWEFIKWMVSGGESGPGSRPSHPEWHRATRDWCAANETPYFFKQWGDWREFDHGSTDYEVDVGSEFAESVLACAIRPGWITRNGRFYATQEGLPDDVPCRLMECVGKKAAGALLDGVAHRGIPA